MRYLILFDAGMLEMPVSKLIGINMAFQHLLHVRQTEMDTMSMDRYMTDADWTLVDKYTRLNNHEFGTERSHQVQYGTLQPGRFQNSVRSIRRCDNAFC